MRISSMNKRVELFEPTIEYDDIGGIKESYVQRTTCWAEFLRPNFGNSTIQGDAGVQVITQGIRLRPTEISRGWIVKAKSHTYEVIHVDTSRKGEIILTTQEVNH